MEIRLPFVDYPYQGLVCPEPTLAQQHFQDETDFNLIMAKWQQSGLITHINPISPIYADVSEIGDYQSSLETIRLAQESFMSLPSSVRDRFDNDPAKLLAFVSDPANADEAIKLGLSPSVDKSVDSTAQTGLSTDSPAGAE